MLDKELSSFSWNAYIDLNALALNLILGLILGIILRWHFKKFGSVFSNRDELGHILPILSVTIILIISIVKSSMALSLGLVGALSIVRFRTPIKEPEELSYIFVAIAIGLGLGAGQREAVILAFAIIIVSSTMIKWQKRLDKSSISYLIISWNSSDDSQKVLSITKTLSEFSPSIKMRKYDISGHYTEITYLIDIRNINDLDSIVSSLQGQIKDVNITIFDQSSMPKI